MTERCELSDLPEDQCACRIHGPAPERPSMSGMFVAMYTSGVCASCLEPVQKGQRIVAVDGQYLHGECVE